MLANAVCFGANDTIISEAVPHAVPLLDEKMLAEPLKDLALTDGEAVASADVEPIPLLEADGLGASIVGSAL